jgi:hypothetical protein
MNIERIARQKTGPMMYTIVMKLLSAWLAAGLGSVIIKHQLVILSQVLYRFQIAWYNLNFFELLYS